MASRRVISTPDDVTRLLAFMGDMPMPYTVTIAQGKGRTLSQNGLLHMWFGEIAKQSDDMSMVDVKGVCHRKFGLPIRLQEAQFSWIWERTGALLNYEKQCSLLASGLLNVSSQMTTQQLTEYMDGMGRDYRQQGYTLTDPEILKYQDVAA